MLNPVRPIKANKRFPTRTRRIDQRGRLRTGRAFFLLSLALPLLPGCGADVDTHPRAAERIAARLETVRVEPLELTYDAVGTVRSRTVTTLSSKVMGQVKEVRVQPGDRVATGDVLVQLEDGDFAAQLRRARAGVRGAESGLEEIDRSIDAATAAKAAAQAQHDLAQATQARYEPLLERRSVSRQEADEVRARHRAAAAELERARALLASLRARRNQLKARLEQAGADATNAEIQLQYTKIKAPFDALITRKDAEVGMLAAPGVPLVTLEDAGRYRLEIGVDESRIAAIGSGPLWVVVHALPGVRIAANVDEIVPAADPVSRSFLVKLALEENEGLRSGMFGRATFVIGRKDAATVPAAALIERGQLTGVFVADDQNRAWLRIIKTGDEVNGRVEVLAGLEPGERVAIDPTGNLREGAAIEAVEVEESVGSRDATVARRS